MATIALHNRLNPTLSEFVVGCNTLGRPGELLSQVTRELVLEAARERDIPIRDGRVILVGDPTRLAALYFGLRAIVMRASLPPTETA